jgi:hypothetical protein
MVNKMPKYKVFVEEVYVTVIEVDSPEVYSGQQAIAVAENIINVGQYPDGSELPEPIYDRTNPAYLWTAEEQ